jgi:hypothetical protein
LKTVDESILQNSTFAELVRLVELDPLPQAHTSAHWQEYGLRTRVTRRDGKLVLLAQGFDGIHESPLLRPLRLAERLSYRKVSRQYRNYEKVLSAGSDVARDLGGTITNSAFIATLAASLLLDHIENQRLTVSSVVIIGDGAGFLGTLLRRLLPNSRLYCIDLPKMLVFQAQAHILTSKARLSVMTSQTGEPAQTTFLVPDAIERVEENVDLAINIDSMQEMNPQSTQAYFAFLRRRSHDNSRFYCLNRESKVFSDGTESVFAKYPWRSDDTVFIDELCPFHTHFLDWHPPFFRRFDGPSRHRLVRLISS